MVYFISDGRYTKIGVATEPEKRLKELQTGNPLDLYLVKTIDGSFEQENAIHTSLSLYRLKGEWFDYNNFDDDIIEFLLEGECGAVVKKKMDRSEAIRLARKKKADKTISVIKDCVENLMNEKRVFITIMEIKKALNSNISKSSIHRYIETFRDEIDTYNRNMFGTDNFMSYEKMLSIHNIKEAIKVLSDANKTLSRRKVAKQAGIHFTTVQKYWSIEEIQNELNKFNQSVK